MKFNTIRGAKTEKKRVETDILRRIRDFEDGTGLAVLYVSIERIDTSDKLGQSSKPIRFEMQVEL